MVTSSSRSMRATVPVVQWSDGSDLATTSGRSVKVEEEEGF
jgi:hypothetical protein